MRFTKRFMKLVFRLAIVIVVLLLLEAVKRLLAASAGPSLYFWFNLLSCTQLFMLLAAIILVILVPLMKRWRVKRPLRLGIVIVLLTFSLLELGCTYLLEHPKKIPSFAFPAFKYYYDHFDCRIIQYEPSTRYDPSLFYRLKDNQYFIYGQREFRHKFSINSAGFRSSEASLKGPQVICLGDSYTLGWGAGEGGAFPALLEQISKLKVLNTGMSSYGTARESMVLQTLDTSRLQYIVWQYCANDQEENRAYLENGRRLPPHSPKQLDSLMDLHRWTRKYFPGRHFFTMAKLMRASVASEGSNAGQVSNPGKGEAEKKKAADFLEIVRGSGINLSKIKIVVIEVGPYPMHGAFIGHLQKLVNEKGLSSSFILLDGAGILLKEDYYILDVHLNDSGNKKVAAAIAKAFSAP
jgi:lysophospholipase L1-like esterase